MLCSAAVAAEQVYRSDLGLEKPLYSIAVGLYVIKQANLHGQVRYCVWIVDCVDCGLWIVVCVDCGDWG